MCCDLKAPLRAIGSLAHWIAEDNAEQLDDEGRENLDILLGRVKRMDLLIDGILRYSRIGRLDPTLETLDADAIVREVIDAVAPPENMEVTVEGTLPTVRFDRTHLQQVFQNLINNAIRHMEKPDGRVTVSCEDRGWFWEFCVRDNGVGIEEKHFDRIFKIFQSLKSRDEQEATGIGLSLVKAITEKHGGAVRVESTPGEGAAFYFTIANPENRELQSVPVVELANVGSAELPNSNVEVTSCG